jgi:hypothetical protein
MKRYIFGALLITLLIILKQKFMKKTFTQIRSIACLLLFIFSIKLAAQPMELKILTPASIAGTYVVNGSGFGPKSATELTGKPMKQGNMPDSLACVPLTTDLTGNIAFIDRGTCSFAPKVLETQKKGAIAAIICNTSTGAFISPGASGVAAVDNAITIQSFMMTKPDCDKIKIELRKGAGVTGSILFLPCAPAKDTTVKNVLWGDKSGEGDFAGGPGKWTIETPAGKGWEWNLWGDVSRGAYAGKVFIGSNTGCNGAMVFDSDFLDTKGSAATAGQGTCPAPCSSSFTSPNIDLSGFTNIKGLSVQFTQAYRQYESSFYLLASYDNGVKWDTFPVNSDAIVNSAVFTNDKIKIGLCGADLSKKQVKLRFAMTGDYYYWAIDDVFLVNDDAADVLIANNFFASPPTYKTPVSQAYTFPLVADVRNAGPVAAENTVLTAVIDRVTGTATAPIFTNVQTETKNYNTLTGCQNAFDVPFTNRAKIPTAEGAYRIKYTLSAPKNDVTTNDTKESFFRLTQNSYSTSLNEPENGALFLENFNTITNPAFVGKNDMTVGQYYFFPKGKGYRATRFFFGVNDNKTQTQKFESILTCSVFKVKPGGTDSQLDPSELTKVAEGFDPALPDNPDLYVDTTTVNRRRLSFILKGLDGKPFQLEDNTGYAFIIKTSYLSGPAYSTTSAVHLFPFLGFAESRFVNFNARGAEFTQNETLKGERTYGGLLNNGDVLTTNAGVKIYNEVIIEPLTNTEEPLAETSFNVYPNPASTELFVDLDLVNIAKTVKIEITDVTGRILASETRTNVKSETVTIPVSRIPSGVYLTKISTPEGSATKKVIIAN